MAAGGSALSRVLAKRPSREGMCRALRPTDEVLLPGMDKRAVGGEGCGVQWAVGISLGPGTDPGMAFPPV